MNPISRREMLKALPAAALAAASGAGARPGVEIPRHLPKRLAICYYGWDWITSALPDEPYGDLDRALRETKERGFNCVRIEAGLNWMFDLEGRRRGKLKFLDWIPGASWNLHCVDGKGGGEHDVFARVMRLFELADRHGLYVITTSWEYQDAISHLADARVRDEILGVPYSRRLMLLARQYDRLLGALRRRGLQRRIAQVELINELNSPPIVCGGPGTSGQTFEEWTAGGKPTPACESPAVRSLAADAIAFLRERHPDLLITVDGLKASTGFATLFPGNAQVADHHVYSDGITQAFYRAAGITAAGPPDERNALLRSVFKPNPMSWSEVNRRAARVRAGWRKTAWLYTNLDNRKFDEWCLEHYAEHKPRIRQSIEKEFQAAAAFARERGLPLVVDEGFIFYPPLHSRFVMTPEGRWGEDVGVNAAIATGHWGVMLSGYFRPNTPPWTDDGQCDWARGLNGRILAS